LPEEVHPVIEPAKALDPVYKNSVCAKNLKRRQTRIG
jgi:hypothetical protein